MLKQTLHQQSFSPQILSPGNTAPAPDLVPVIREQPADLETPVSVYLKLAGQGPSFLLESVTGGEQVARYSFIGVNPSRAFIIRGETLECHTLQTSGVDRGRSIHCDILTSPDPLAGLRAELARYHQLPVPGLPRLVGGLVGYLSYDIVRYFEPSVPLSPHADLPEAVFLLADTLVAFDHAFGRLVLIANTHLDGDERLARDAAEARLDAIQQQLAGPVPKNTALSSLDFPPAQPILKELESNLTQEQFTSAVLKAKEYIAAGEIFQVVLSQRLSRETSATPFNIYRALRRLNPSPYMYFFDFNTLIDQAGESGKQQPLRVIGASPEMHVRLEGHKASVRPIAGTRPRGGTPQRDAALESELLADPKELAEHVMLVDLGRNDLGRVCEFGSVKVPEQMVVERYSHVMHIVSHVEGQLSPEYDAFDLMRATFPAGTVTGAPKIRAMQIIHELEGEPRGPYAGAVGYFSYDGSLDTCITIRTLLMRGQTISIQAGAGVVADSDPQREYQETLNKARALAVAVEMAESET